jgi:DNA-binding transcriptional MerR regulator
MILPKKIREVVMDSLITATPAAKILGCSSENVRDLESRGILIAFKTSTGARLFREADVLALAEKRHQSASVREGHRR